MNTKLYADWNKDKNGKLYMTWKKELHTKPFNKPGSNSK